MGGVVFDRPKPLLLSLSVNVIDRISSTPFTCSLHATTIYRNYSNTPFSQRKNGQNHDFIREVSIPGQPLALEKSKMAIPAPRAVRILRQSKLLSHFCVFYTPLFAPWRRDRQDLNPHNVLYYKLLDDYQNMPQDTLRWLVTANTSIKEVPKAVMRERLRRRVREAFRESLKLAGYDWKNGKLLQRDEATVKQTPSQDLRGTLEIHCRGRAPLDCEFAEIVDYANIVVHEVVTSSSWSNAIPPNAWLPH